jgi:hypothetical protein
LPIIARLLRRPDGAASTTLSTAHDSSGRTVNRQFSRCDMLDACSIVLCATRWH